MLSVREHIEKARHNQDFVDHLNPDSTRFLDWVVTGHFYAALHFVGAYLQTRGAQSFSHVYTDTVMLEDPNLDRIYADYSDLKNDSFEARYGTRRFTSEYVQESCQPSLDSIIECVRPFLPA